jgi:aminoglycoside phosphotransferase (APT) family kinase protein
LPEPPRIIGLFETVSSPNRLKKRKSLIFSLEQGRHRIGCAELMSQAKDVSEQKQASAQPGELEESLCRLGLLEAGEAATITPLTGGVSSDISLVEAGGRRFCVKRALPRLKVAALWEAPIGRNAAEAAYFRAVARWLPRAVPRILAEDPHAGLFAMDYLPPERFPLWKAELLEGRVDQAFAASVGRDLALIHARSAADPDVRKAFAHDETFEAIRIEPYLRATARAHPALAARLDALAEITLSTKRALVHGDVSPKNILLGPDGTVLLDAECAWFGDPAFDLAFCLNHLLLKGAREGAGKAPYLAAFAALAGAYFAGVDWEAPAEVEARAAGLLPALFLARVDGKSPVEYLTREAEREAVRSCAAPLIAAPPRTVAAVAEAWSRAR